MAIQSGLRTLLLAQSGITSLLHKSGTAFPGIYNDAIPQKAPSDRYIILTLQRSELYTTLDGATGMEEVDFDIDCKGRTRAQAANIARTVAAFLRNYTGSAGDETIKAVKWNDTLDNFEPDQSGNDRGLYTTTLDVAIQYEP